MKRLLVTLPLAVVFSGCSAPAAENTAATTGAAPAPAATTANEAAPETSALSYTIVDEAPQGAPEKLSKALKKVAIEPPPASFKLPATPKVKLATSIGDITVTLDAKAAPLHAKSFYYLASKGFYDGVRFHRWADLTGDTKGYIIQGGDPLTKNQDAREFAGMGGPGYQIPREYNSLKHDQLVIAAARSNDPNSAGSQFYITQGPVYFLDQGEGYTVFGKVTAGQDVALKLRQGALIKKATPLK